MKHVISIPTIILFLGVCALGLTSCVGDEAHDPQPPATALENEPTSVPETNQGVPVFSGAQPANNDSIKPPPASGHAVTSVPSFPPAQTNQASSAAPVIAVSKPIALAAVSLQPHSWLDSKVLFWLLNWLTLLVLLASVRQLRSRRQEKVMTASKVRRGENGAFEKLAAIHRQKEIAVTAFFKSQKHKMHFSPAATVKKVTAWAAYQCEIFDQDTMEV
ncbi:MAG TPA: hypothetical protein VN963_08550, partial [bacterium]|nr:hypothetical protein [bacterium]